MTSSALLCHVFETPARCQARLAGARGIGLRSSLQSLCGDHPGRDGDPDRVGQIHAAQLIASGIQVSLHAAESQIQDFRDFLIGLSPRRPDHALFFTPGQADVRRGGVEIDVRSRINEDRQQLQLGHVLAFVLSPLRPRLLAGKGDQSIDPPSIPNRDRQAVAADAVVRRVIEERTRRRILVGQSLPVERKNGVAFHA